MIAKLISSANHDNLDEDFKFSFMREKCELHFESASKSKLYKEVILPLGKIFGKSESDIYSSFLRYNLEINSYTNEFYSTFDSRFALAINYLLPGTWFYRRLEKYIDVCQRFRKICDVGFGVPLVFIYHALKMLPPKRWRFHYFDKFQSAQTFAKPFIDLIRNAYPSLFANHIQVEYGFLDLDAPEDAKVKEKTFDLMILADCVEHASTPKRTLRSLLKNFEVKEYLISLPVGTIIPQHAIEFVDQCDVLNFLRNGRLQIDKTEMIEAYWESDLIGNEDFSGSLFVQCTHRSNGINRD